MTFNVSTGLSAPPGTNLGVPIIYDNVNLSDYLYIISAGANDFVARNFDGSVTVRSTNGKIRRYDCTSGPVYADNVYVDPARNQVFLPYVESQKTYLRIVSLSTNNVLKTYYISNDFATPSLVYRQFESRIYLYKSNPQIGVAGHAYIYSVHVVNLDLIAHHDGTVGTDVQLLHLFFNSGNNELYRTIIDSSGSKIQRLTQTTTDDQVYATNPVGGIAFVVNDTNTDDIYYPVVFNTRIYTLSADAKRISAWSILVSNSQVLLPFEIDSRAGLLHASAEKVYYNRFIIDYSTNILHDTRTYYSIDTATLTQVPQYNVCTGGAPYLNFNVNNVLDSKAVRKFSDSKYAYYSIDSEVGVYHLDSSAFCPVDIAGESADINIQPGIKKVYGTDVLSKLIGINPIAIANRSALQIYDIGDSGLRFWSETQTPGTSHVVYFNGGSHQSLIPNTENRLQHSKILFKDRLRAIYRSNTKCMYFNGSTLLELTGQQSLTDQRYCFLYNDVFYVIASGGIWTYNTLTNTSGYSAIAWSSINSVRLFVSYDGQRLYHFDKRQPTYIRQINVVPLFDFTNSANYTNSTYFKTITTTLQDGSSKGLSSTEWSVYEMDNEYAYYVDYSNGKYEFWRRLNLLHSTGTVTAVSALERPGAVTTAAGYVFDRNITNVLSRRASQIVAYSDLKIESPSYTGEISLGSADKYSFFVTDSGICAGAPIIDANASHTIYKFTSRFARLAETPALLNSHGWRLRINNDVVLSFNLSEKAVEYSAYKRMSDLSGVDLVGFQNTSKIMAPSNGVSFYTFEASYVVNEADLLKIEALYELQWKAQRSGDFLRIYFDDFINKNPDSTPVKQMRAGYLQYKRFVVMLTEPPRYNWVHLDTYRVQLKFMEVEISNSFDAPIYI